MLETVDIIYSLISDVFKYAQVFCGSIAALRKLQQPQQQQQLHMQLHQQQQQQLQLLKKQQQLEQAQQQTQFQFDGGSKAPTMPHPGAGGDTGGAKGRCGRNAPRRRPQGRERRGRRGACYTAAPDEAGKVPHAHSVQSSTGMLYAYTTLVTN